MKYRITKLSGKNHYKIWLNTKDVNGKRKRPTRNFWGTQGKAESEAIRLVREIETGTFLEASTTTVSEYLDWWLDNYSKPNNSSRTYEGYESIIRHHLKPAFGTIKLAKLSPAKIQEYYAQSLKSGRLDGEGGLKERTVLSHHRVLHEALEKAVRTGLLIRNPVRSTDPPKAQRHQTASLTQDEVTAMVVVAADTRLYYPLLVAVATGVRRGELLGLRWSDVDLSANTICIRQSLQRTGGELTFKEPKSSKERVVKIPTSLADTLRKHHAEQSATKLERGKEYHDNGLLFPDDNGSPWNPNAFTGIWDRFKRKHDFDYRWHDLRHTQASWLLSLGVHPKVVQERLGHSTIAITMDLYSHVAPHLQDEAADKLDDPLRAVIGDTAAVRD